MKLENFSILMKFDIKQINKISNFTILIQFHCVLYKTPLCIAIEKENDEIVQVLLKRKDIQINVPYVLIIFFFE